MKKLTLHLGLHKTGSTSIQESCLKNQALLESKGIYYPTFKLWNHEGLETSNHSRPIFSLFCDAPEEFFDNIIQECDIAKTNQFYLEQLNECLEKNFGHIVLSGEMIPFLSTAKLEKFKLHLESFGWDIHPIVYIREPLKHDISAYAQIAKMGLYTQNSKLTAINTKDELESIRKVFPNADYYSLKIICKDHDGPVEHFLHALGIDNVSEFEILKENISLSNHSVRLLAYLNNRLPLIHNNKKNHHRELNDTELLESIPGDKFHLTEEEYIKCKKNVEARNKYLKINFGEEFCDDFSDIHLGACLWGSEQLDYLENIVDKLPQTILFIVFDYLLKEASFTDEQFKKVSSWFHFDQYKTTKMKQILSKHTNLLRDLALNMEQLDLKKAHELMELANITRPNGKLIQKKLKDYKRKLGL